MATQQPPSSGKVSKKVQQRRDARAQDLGAPRIKVSMGQLKQRLTTQRQAALRSRQTATGTKAGKVSPPSALKVSAPARPKPRKAPAPPSPKPAPKKVARGKVPEHLRPFLFKKQNKGK